MFYLLKKKSEMECGINERVMVLADFYGIRAGTKGKIVEIYGNFRDSKDKGGVMVEWDRKVGDFGYEPTRDGFGRDELEYLAFETETHPTKS